VEAKVEKIGVVKAKERRRERRRREEVRGGKKQYS